MKKLFLTILFLLLPFQALALHTMATDNSDGTYLYITCDGFSIQFDKTGSVYNYVVIYNESETTSYATLVTGRVYVGSTIYCLGFDTDRITSVTSTDSVVKVVVSGTLETTGHSALANTTSYVETWHIYPDHHTTECKLILSGDVIFPAQYTNNSLYGLSVTSANLANEDAIGESSGSEISTVDATAYNTADYLGSSSDEVDIITIWLDGTDTSDDFRYCMNTINSSRFGWADVTLGSGTHYQTFLTVVDSATRDGSAKAYSSADNISWGDQANDVDIDS